MSDIVYDEDGLVREEADQIIVREIYPGTYEIFIDGEQISFREIQIEKIPDPTPIVNPVVPPANPNQWQDPNAGKMWYGGGTTTSAGKIDTADTITWNSTNDASSNTIVINGVSSTYTENTSNG